MTHLLPAATLSPSEPNFSSLGKLEGKQVRLREMEAEGRGAFGGGTSGFLALVSGWGVWGAGAGLGQEQTFPWVAGR